MINEWNDFPPSLQLVLSTEALKRARLIVGAQAQMLADQMDRGSLPSFDGPDALRLFAMILGQDDPPEFCDHSHIPAQQQVSALA